MTTQHTPSAQPTSAAPPAATARIGGLDGIRALGVIGVILYHTDLAWSPAAGFLGVDVFFTLSGFLITALLLREHRATGGIDLPQFYLRRARRLLPALWLLLLFVIAAGLLVSHDTLAGLRSDVPAALLYVSNWWQIHHGESYFELIGRPAPLQHLWSLSIEEQFYLLWPTALLLVLARHGASAIGRISLALAGAGTAWLWILAARHGYPADTDPSRGYFGLDSHSMGLFVGAALASYWNPWRTAPLVSRRRSEAAGVAALVALVVMFFDVTESTAFLYRGGFLLVAVLTAVLIHAVVDRRTTLGRLFSAAPLTWIGERSYGLYLWHWPVFGLLRPGLDVPLGPVACLVPRIAITLAITELSFRFVERPIRTGRFGYWPEPERRRFVVGGKVALGTAALLGVLLYLQPARRGDLPADVAAAIGDGAPHRVAGGAGRARRTDPEAPGRVRGQGAAKHATAVARAEDAPSEVLAIGDSVMLGAARMLGRNIDGLEIDAEVGRQARDIVARIKELKTGGQLAPRVILHMGTNGYVTETQLRTILDALRDRESVVLVNATAPRRWVDDNNVLFREAAATHANVTLFDWHALAESHPEYFVSDGVHLSTAGLRVFASELVRVGRFTPPAAAPAQLARTEPEVRGIVVGSREPVHHAPSEVRVAEARPADESTDDRVLTPAADSMGADEPVAVAAVEPALAMAPAGPPLHTNPRPIALDAFWDRIAACASGGDWTRRGSPGGGLGIRARAWRAYGGGEFALTPGGATREQQILVANRISTQGWAKRRGPAEPPVGFGGWPCVRSVGRPLLLVHTSESVLAQSFQWGQTGGTVEELQAVLDVPRSGHYDLHTWRAHVKMLASHDFPRSLAPESPMAFAGGRTGR